MAPIAVVPLWNALLRKAYGGQFSFRFGKNETGRSSHAQAQQAEERDSGVMSSFARPSEDNFASVSDAKLVVEDGFEPSKGGAQLIYSQSPLATWVLHRTKGGEVRALFRVCQAVSCAISALYGAAEAKACHGQ